jgi:sugar/nucleoside kinase (ribokinase family)
MAIHEFIGELTPLSNQRQIGVIGAAVIDVIADAYSLPYRGSDIELHQQSINVGGCALNVAITLHRLGIGSINALPIGQGIWSDIIRGDLDRKGIRSITQNLTGDNGWCLALVEPDGERTFLSVSGVENQWTPELLAEIGLQPHALLYVSGYQLASSTGPIILDWLESLDSTIRIFIDFGPRIADISAQALQRLLALNLIITLNRQEAEHVQKQWLKINDNLLNIEKLTNEWFRRFSIPLIIRVDKEGAFCCQRDEIVNIAPYPITVVDTIGAGDSHAGGVLAGLASGWSLKNAVRLGNAVASYVVGHRGGDCAPPTEELSKHLAGYNN